jgi:hypothetical protein
MAKEKDSKFYYPPNRGDWGKGNTEYNRDVVAGENARDNQRLDTSPYLQKEGYLGVDDLDRLRRRKISKIF